MKQDSIARFISRLEVLGGIAPGTTPDRGALAALRRSVATWPAIPAGAVRVVAPFLPGQASGWRETTYYLVAALFALHPCLSSQGDYGTGLGRALREAAVREKAQGGEAKGPERRLLELLGCRNEDLPTHLRHAVSYLRAKGVSVDYRQLMRDLSWWDAVEGDVQRRWGRDFWSGTLPDEEQPEPGESVAQESSHVH
jgi:CRISPR system Cascade subunit CasB